MSYEYPVKQASHTLFVQVAQFESTQGITLQIVSVLSHDNPVEQTSHIAFGQESQLSNPQGDIVILNIVNILPP